jgi:hypothetical protein
MFPTCDQQMPCRMLINWQYIMWRLWPGVEFCEISPLSALLRLLVVRVEEARTSDVQWRTECVWVGDPTPATRNYEVLSKLSRIPSSEE